ncbi:hypothetical protein BKA93DRAFT_750196 [Sparassis latifolia]
MCTLEHIRGIATRECAALRRSRERPNILNAQFGNHQVAHVLRGTLPIEQLNNEDFTAVLEQATTETSTRAGTIMQAIAFLKEEPSYRDPHVPVAGGSLSAVRRPAVVKVVTVEDQSGAAYILRLFLCSFGQAAMLSVCVAFWALLYAAQFILSAVLSAIVSAVAIRMLCDSQYTKTSLLSSSICSYIETPAPECYREVALDTTRSEYGSLSPIDFSINTTAHLPCDDLAATNYASYATGARSIEPFTSSTYPVPGFNLLFWHNPAPSHSALRSVLSDNGGCWSMVGSSGYFTVELSQPRAEDIVHASHADFVLRRHALPVDLASRLGDTYHPFPLMQFMYDAHVLDNWGSRDFTCLCYIGIYGDV